MHCTDKELLGMLDEHEVDVLSRSDAVQHLESCPHCQSRLAEISGEGPWLSDWIDSVHKDTCDLVVDHVPSSVVIAVDTSDMADSQISCEPIRLDFLEPARHPELLGRLGRYDIERLIGMGGFGVVFKARDSELNRVVAIKVLAPHLMSSGAARDRFAREAQASAAVVHDHVVPIYDVVSQATACYFVMKYIAGQSLQERVDSEGPLPIEEVLRIATQMAAGLEAAHEQGLIHRDVKPGNVLLEDTVERVLISDFGLARTADDASLTRSGVITGTPHYMSPEQARGVAVDPRSDLFSLGSVIYFMCTGHSPFRAGRMMAVLNRICHEPHRPLGDVNRTIPRQLVKIVDRLLAKSPHQRYASAAQTRQALNQLLSDLQSGKIRQPAPDPAGTLVSKHSATVLIGCAVLCLVAWLGWTLWPARGRQRPRADIVAPEKVNAPQGSFDGPARLSVPADEFACGLEETNSIIERIETSQADVTVSSASSWHTEIAAINQTLDRLERGLEDPEPQK